MEEENLQNNQEEQSIQEEPKESCCGPVPERKERSFLSGLFYGLVPHTGCIAFIIFTILGVTAAASFIRPLLLSRYFFHILIALSLVFATISASIYLKKRNMLSMDGIKTKRKYLFTLYGTSVAINLLLFLVIFPIAANMSSATPTGAFIGTSSSDITMQVDIPCPGHAPLISESLKEIDGVQSVKYSFPKQFDVKYDSTITSKEEIFSLDVFNYYPVTGFELGATKEDVDSDYQVKGCGTCNSCSGACGGSCGG